MENVVEDFSKLSHDKQELYAEKFCENNEDLKRLLLKMWGNGIQTYACCAGHEISEGTLANGIVLGTNPYLYFDVKTLNEKQQSKLYKNLIMISKNLNLIDEFSFELDNCMGFVKHGVSIRLKNDNVAFKVLNDLFDTILKKEGLIEQAKQFLIKRNKDDGLTSEELSFVESMVELNDLNFEDYTDNSNEMPPDKKLTNVELKYHNKDMMQVQVRDAVKQKIYYEGNENKIVFWCTVAEGMYTKDPHLPDIYYTVKNDKVIEIDASRIEGMKEYISERRLNNTTRYSQEKISEIKNHVEKISSVLKSKDV